MAQVIEGSPSTHAALGSVLSTEGTERAGHGGSCCNLRTWASYEGGLQNRPRAALLRCQEADVSERAQSITVHCYGLCKHSWATLFTIHFSRCDVTHCNTSTPGVKAEGAEVQDQPGKSPPQLEVLQDSRELSPPVPISSGMILKNSRVLRRKSHC